MDSLSNKTNRLDHLLATLRPNITILTEHGLKKEQLLTTKLNGYKLLGGFTRETYKKGGVAIYVSETLGNKTENFNISNKSEEMTCELHTVHLKIGKKSAYLLGVYRPPSGNLDTALGILSETLDMIPTWKCPTIIMGDFNVDGLTADSKKKKLDDMLTSHNIERLDLPPTRVTHNSISSIDFVCTNVHNTDIKTDVIITGLSDHRAQLCKVNFTTQKVTLPKSTHRSFSFNNLNTLKSLLSAESWYNMYCIRHVDQMYDSFNSILHKLLNSSCPLTKSRHKTTPSFKTITNEETHRLKNNYLQALETQTQCGTEEAKKETATRKKEYDLKLKQLRRQATSDYIEKADNKQKALWYVINHERCNNNKRSEQVELMVDQNLLQDPYQIAQYFNNHFTTIAEKTLNNAEQVNQINIEQQHTNQNIPDLTLYPTTKKEILKIISNLISKPSAGVDEFSSIVLKHCKEEIAQPLTIIINKSFSQGVFPTALKLAKVFPKFKKGSKTSADNYRPISILSTISKVIEKVMLARLLTHLTAHDLLSTQQHGFLKGKSTTTALVQLTEYIIDQIEEGSAITGILLDFSKAFDTIDHTLLLDKLRRMGIRGTANKWFSSYLTGRTQLVEISYKKNNTIYKERSTPLPIRRGVPQGSVLGPVLFILLTNDLPRYLQEYSQVTMYADDTALLVTNRRTTELEVSSYIALNMAMQYCQQNDLVLNQAKTQQLNFGRASTELLSLPEIMTGSEAKYLGIIIDDKLNWTPHIDQLCGKLNSSLYVLKRIMSTSDLGTAKIAYFSLFETHIRYGLIVWGNSSINNMQRVMVLQKRAVRTLAGLNSLETCRTAFKELSILTVASLYISEVICYAVSNESLRMEDGHSYNTRNNTNFILPTHHLTLFEKKPSYAGSKLFNLLPDHLKRASTEKSFKQKLTGWLLQWSFYTVEEFIHLGHN